MTGQAIELAPYVGSEALERAQANHDTLAQGRHGQGADRDRIIARRVTIVELHWQGFTERQIADVVGIGKSQVHREIVKAREEWRERTAAAMEARIEEEDAKLDHLERHWMAEAIVDKDAAVLVLKIMDRRARLLGLDKPAKLEVSHPDQDAQRQRAQELLGHADELKARRERTA